MIVFDNFDINVKRCLEKARRVLSLRKNAPISGVDSLFSIVASSVKV